MFKQFREITLSGLVMTALLLSVSYSQSIDYLNPSSGTQGENDLQVYLYASGVNFYDIYSNPGIPYNVSFSGSGISVSNFYVVNSSTVRFEVDISDNATISSRDVTLDYYYSSCQGCPSYDLSLSEEYGFRTEIVNKVMIIRCSRKKPKINR